tara:strand:+ start:10935 stop:11315 length:381 start_codon:yes stop_codon:yes gene_type:complete
MTVSQLHDKINSSPVVPHLSHLVDGAGLTFVSGQLAFVDGQIMEGGIAEQTAQVLVNIESILAERGLTRQNIVKTTVWITRRSDFAGFNTAYAAFFGDLVRPARSTVIAELALPDALVEIEAIATM